MLTLQLLASLRAAADSGEREAEHRNKLLAHLETASLGFLAPKSGSFVMTGPDGFSYFPFYIPSAPSATAGTVDMVGQHSVSRYSTSLGNLRDKLWASACGVALYYTQIDAKAALEHTTLKGQLPAYVLTHGELLGYHLTGTLQLPEQTEDSSAVEPELQVGRSLFPCSSLPLLTPTHTGIFSSPASHSHTVSSAVQGPGLAASVPPEDYLPSSTRAAMGSYLRKMGVDKPKFALVVRPGQVLGSSVKELWFRSEGQDEPIPGPVMQGLRWFLPADYVLCCPAIQIEGVTDIINFDI